jgi:hypothetical protein
LRAAELGESLSTGVEVDSTGFALLKIAVTLSPVVLNAAAAAAAAGGANASAAATVASLHGACDTIAAAIFGYIKAAREDVERAVAVAASRSIIDGGCGELGFDRGDITGGVINQTSSVVLKNALGQLASCPGNSSHRSFLLWRDSKLIAEVAFRFPTKPLVSKLASSLAKAMQRSGPRDILSPPARRVWQPAVLLDLLQALNPKNALYFLQSKALPPHALPLHEPIYSQMYQFERVSAPILNWLTLQPIVELPPRIDNASIIMALPPPNPFLPTSFSIVEHGGYGALLGIPDKGMYSGKLVDHTSLLEVASTELKTRVDSGVDLHAMLLPVGDIALLGLQLSGTGLFEQLGALSSSPLSLYWLPDTFFGLPRTHVAFELVSSAASSSPFSSVLTALWIDSTQVAFLCVRTTLPFTYHSFDFISHAASFFTGESIRTTLPDRSWWYICKNRGVGVWFRDFDLC